MKHFFTAAIIALLAALARAEDMPKTIDREIGIEIRPSWIIPTNSFVRNNGINTAIAPHLRYSFRFSPSTHEGYFHPHTYQGIGLSYSSIPKHNKLGHPTTLYVFQGGPIASLGSRFSIDYEWNFGISAGWKAFDPDKDEPNTAIGSSVNAYLNVGIIFAYRLNRHWKILAGAEASHFSDGNSRLPNPGINTTGGRIGLSYTIGETPVFASAVTYDFNPGWGFDLLAYGAPRQRSIENSEGAEHIFDHTFAIGGLTFAPMYAFNPLIRAGASLDLQYDDSANLYRNRVEGTPDDSPLFYRQPFRERFSAGISAHFEITMPIFSINIGVGRNVLAKGADTSIFYQTLALKAYVFRNSFINIGYQLRNFHDPNNLMLGFGYTFGNR